MNLFDNAKWLKISELKKLDNELLNYIDNIYNKFPKLHYTDDEWINIIKYNMEFNNNDRVNFVNKYLNRYLHGCINNTNIIMYTFIKYDTNRLKNIVKKLSINQIFDILASINFLDIIFTINNNVKSNEYLYSLFLNHRQLYYSYIYARIIFPLYVAIISYLLPKYPNDNSIDLFLMDFYDRQVMSNIYNNTSYNKSCLLKIINNEYMQKMQPYAYSLYNCYIKKFAAKPNFKLLNAILEYNIKLIDTNNSLKIINFVKIHNELLHQKTLNAIIASCNLTAKQIDELKAYYLLNNI